MVYKIKEIRKKLKSRLNSQRRIFYFDSYQILILPFLEHDNVDLTINRIRLFINDKGQYITLGELKTLKNDKNGNIVLELQSGESHFLFYRKLDNSFIKAKFNRFNFEKLTIDHVPSIYIVLYANYLSKSKTFKVLSDFCSEISKDQLNTKTIKAKGFREKVENIMNNLQPMDKKALINAYAEIFKDICLEITISDNNNANLSFESLEYYKNFKMTGLNGSL